MYYFRVLRDEDGWVCKRGARVLERCDTPSMAVMVAESEASVHRPSEVLLHDVDDHVEIVARYDAYD